MADESHPRNGIPAEHAALARDVLRGAKAGSLATLLPDGTPFASLVTVGFDVDGAPLLLLSKLAVHTQNLARDDRASLLLVADSAAAPARLADSRVTLVGRTAPAADQDAARELFLAAHPEAGGYARFADFAAYRFETLNGHLVAGFGRISTIPAEMLFGPAGR